MIWLVLAVLVALYWFVNVLVHATNLHKLPHLPVRTEALPTEPRVSVIVAAKEEAQAIQHTLQTILQQHYTNFELIAINDRSEDDTGEQIAAAKRWAEANGYGHIRFEVLQIEQLPDGWLGKNHALWRGSQLATGEYLLFTDADIDYQPDALRSAVAYAEAEQADLLALAPALEAKSYILRAFVQYFLYGLALLKQLWRVNDDRQRNAGFGIGAFNLMRRTAYDQLGTHRAIAMRPDDDLQLGLAVKRVGLRQRLVLGADHIAVEWYGSLREAVRGLEKNMFAGMNYSILLFIAAVLGQLLFFFVPFVAPFFTDGLTQVLFAAAAGMHLLLYALYNWRMSTYSGAEALLLPFTTWLFVYVIIRSTVLTLRQGGIYWRGTFYTLEQLRAMK